MSARAGQSSLPACSAEPDTQGRLGWRSAAAFSAHHSSRWLGYATFVLLATACFSPSIDGEFVFDDNEAILSNADLLPETPVGSLLHNDFWGRPIASNASHKSYRPLTVLTFRLNYAFAGGLHPRGFHACNLLLHAVVCVLVFEVVTLLCNGAALASAEPPGGGSAGTIGNGVPLFATLLFTVHPVHTESVAAIVGRADLLCALFFLSSFLFYHRSAACNKSGYWWRATLFLSASMSCCLAATVSKEQGITVLGLCSAYDVVILHGIQIFRWRKGTDSVWHIFSSKPLLFRHAALAVTGMSIAGLRWSVMGFSPPTFQVADNPHSFVEPAWLRAINYSYLYALNGWLLLCPNWLCFDWSMGCVPTLTSPLADARLLAVLLLWTVAALLLWRCCRPSAGRLDYWTRLVVMAVAFIVIPFLPASNLFFRVGFVVAERALYLPSVGHCLLVALGLSRLLQRFAVDAGDAVAGQPLLRAAAAPKAAASMVSSLWDTAPQAWRAVSHYVLPPLLLAAFSALMVLHCARSATRSRDWTSEARLFASGTTVCPLNAKVHYNVAKVLADSGHTNEAIARYRVAISLSPEYDQAMNNLANMLKDSGALLEAEGLLDRVVQLRPEFAAAWMNRGIVKASLKKYDEAEISYAMALAHRSNYADCLYNLGNLRLEQKQHTAALHLWREAVRANPKHGRAWSNLLLLLDELGAVTDFDGAFTEAVSANPSDGRLYFIAGSAYGKAGRMEASQRCFSKAAELEPDNALYWSNLGVLYHRWGRYDQAEAAYRESLRLQHSEAVKKNLDSLPHGQLHRVSAAG